MEENEHLLNLCPEALLDILPDGPGTWGCGMHDHHIAEHWFSWAPTPEEARDQYLQHFGLTQAILDEAPTG